MPLYRVQCDECGHESDLFRPLSQYDDLPDHCGTRMHRMICAPMVTVDIGEYRSIVTGEQINGRRQHKEHLKKHGLHEIGNEPIKPREYRGDHSLKPELVQAIKQHLG